MLRIDNLKLPVGVKEDKLRAACAHVLRVSEEALVSRPSSWPRHPPRARA